MDTEFSRLPPPLKRSGFDILVFLSVAGDLAAGIVGLYLGFWFRFQSGLIKFSVDAGKRDLAEYGELILMGATLLVASFAYLRMYEFGNLLRFRNAFRVIVQGLTIWLAGYLSLSLVLKFQPPISRIYVLTSYAFSFVILVLWRWAFHRLMRSGRTAASLRQKILLVGWSDEAARLCSAVQADSWHSYEVIGFLEMARASGRSAGTEAAKLPCLGTYADLSQVLQKQPVDIAILAEADTMPSSIMEVADLCEQNMVRFKVIPSYFQILVSGLRLETVSGIPLLGVTNLPLDRLSNRLIKRVIDIVGSCAGIVVSSLIWFPLGILIYLESPGNIFFIQERVGRGGRKFKMIKLRSMKLGSDKSDHLNQSTLRDDPRMLRVGKFIRRFNLDETPQFMNVLMGDMSLVGPRPERTFHTVKLAADIPHYNARHFSKPGITGWAQIHGFRGDTDLVERIKYDLYYLENWSIWMDFQIMGMTFFSLRNAY